MIPLDVIESESFRDLIKYCPPSAKDILKSVESYKKNIQQCMLKIKV